MMEIRHDAKSLIIYICIIINSQSSKIRYSRRKGTQIKVHNGNNIRHVSVEGIARASGFSSKLQQRPLRVCYTPVNAVLDVHVRKATNETDTGVQSSVRRLVHPRYVSWEDRETEKDSTWLMRFDQTTKLNRRKACK